MLDVIGGWVGFSILTKLPLKLGNLNPLLQRVGFVLSVGGAAIVHLMVFYVIDMPHHSAWGNPVVHEIGVCVHDWFYLQTTGICLGTACMWLFNGMYLML